MTTKKRIVLIVGGALGFIVLTPAVLLYSLGYRYYPQTGAIGKIGMIIAEFDPETATVSLDGRSVAKKSPAKIRNLVAGNYNVSITAPGKTSWQKNLSVEEGLITLTPHIHLFPLNPVVTAPLAGATTDASLFTPSPNAATIAFIEKEPHAFRVLTASADGKSITTVFPRTAEDTEFATKITGVTQIVWSRDSRKFLTEIALEGDKITYLVIDTKKNTATSLSNSFGFSITAPQWDQSSSEFIYWLTENKLHRYDTGHETLSNALASDVAGFQVVGNSVLTVKKTANEEALWSMDKDGARPKQLSLALDQDASYEIVSSPKGSIAVRGRTTKNLWIFSSTAQLQSPLQTETDVERVIWTTIAPNKEVLICATSHEIAALLIADQARETITRISSSIKDIALYPGFDQLLFLTDQGVQAIDLSFEGNRNAIVITAATPKTSGLFVSPDGSFFSMTAVDDQGKSIYETVALN